MIGLRASFSTWSALTRSAFAPPSLRWRPFNRFFLLFKKGLGSLLGISCRVFTTCWFILPSESIFVSIGTERVTSFALSRWDARNRRKFFPRLWKRPFTKHDGCLFRFFSYMDDTLTANATFAAATRNLMTFATLLHSLGFLLHARKSVTVPTQHILYLSFVINLVSMSLKLPDGKAARLFDYRQTTLFETGTINRDSD